MKFSLFFFSDDGASTDRYKYRLLIEAARFADSHGFTAIWTPERHFAPFGGLYPNPAVTSAALAMVTQRISLRGGSVIVPLHHTLRVAEEWSVVDNLSGGRVGVSLGRGWNANDFVLAPYNFEPAREVMYEALDTLRRLWRGESLSLPNGKGYEFKAAIYPRPVQHELPIWLTAESELTFVRAGQLGTNLLTHLVLRTVEDLQRCIRLYHRSLVDAGHDPSCKEVTLMMHTYLDPDSTRARAQIEKAYGKYVENYLQFLSAGERKVIAGQDEEFVKQRAIARLFESHGIVGAPVDCVERILRAEAAGITEIACLIDFGIEADAVLAALQYLVDLRNLVNS